MPSRLQQGVLTPDCECCAQDVDSPKSCWPLTIKAVSCTLVIISGFLVSPTLILAVFIHLLHVTVTAGWQNLATRTMIKLKHVIWNKQIWFWVRIVCLSQRCIPVYFLLLFNFFFFLLRQTLHNTFMLLFLFFVFNPCLITSPFPSCSNCVTLSVLYLLH